MFKLSASFVVGSSQRPAVLEITGAFCILFFHVIVLQVCSFLFHLRNFLSKMLGIPVTKEFGLNAISFWVPALIDFCQKTEGTWEGM